MSKKKKMYVKMKYQNKSIQYLDDRINQQTKNYNNVKFINWRIDVNGNSTVM